VPWKPSEPGEIPTLGYTIIDWIAAYLSEPDKPEYEPFILYPEQEQFVLRYYAIDPKADKRRIRRGVISRAKGWGKSPLLAAISAAEALAPVVFDGWDANGQPVGRPWWTVRTPWVQLAAVSEDQTRNAWAPLLEMLREGPVLDEYVGLDPMDSFVSLPGKGRIEYVTSSSTSREGNRPTFCVLDQTEEWRPSNSGVKLAATLRRNLGKTGGTSIESPNAYLPGEGSVAEESAAYAAVIENGHARDTGFLYDHREAPAETDMADRDSLLRGLDYAYGDASGLHGGHIDLDRILAEVWDPGTDPQDARRFYLNQITHATDSYISQPEWAGCLDEERKVQRGEAITLGFDGSRGRAKGKPDATGLVGCTIADGHMFQIGVWEAEDGPGMEEWEPPIVEIDAAIADAFSTYNVIGLYADPAKDWRSKVNEWENQYSRKTPLKVTKVHPFEWWMVGGRSHFIQRAVQAFEAAVRNNELTHDGAFRLTQHVLNARRRIRRQKLTIGKEHDFSSNKVDLCVCSILAWQARLDAIAAGYGKKRRGGSVKRVR